MPDFIGIDNGVSGTIGILSNGGMPLLFDRMPTKVCLDYQKQKKKVTRINGERLSVMLAPFKTNSVCMIERPMVNPMRFKATLSAIRAFETTICVLEVLKIGYTVVDSKEWQRALLPKNIWRMTEGKVKDGKKQGGRLKADPDELKFASLQKATQRYPTIEFRGFSDADGLLIARYCRMTEGGIDNG